MHVYPIEKFSHEFLRDRMKNHVKRLQSWKKCWQILKLVSSSNSNWQCRNYHLNDSYKKWHVFQISSLVLLLRKWFKISMISCPDQWSYYSEDLQLISIIFSVHIFAQKNQFFWKNRYSDFFFPMIATTILFHII